MKEDDDLGPSRNAPEEDTEDSPDDSSAFITQNESATDRVKRIEEIEALDTGEEELWDEIGIHKTIGGNFFRNFVFMLAGAVISVVTFTFVIGVLIPYPTAKGYYDVSQGLFSFVFMIFDVGTAYGIQRFIAEYQVKDKRKMLHYIQFYIWYQCFTGLIQVTAISIWIFESVPNGDLAYLSWILLIINVKQYPGMLGTFVNCIKGLQRYDKSIIINFVTTDGFTFLTQIVFFIGGRYYGQAHPVIGGLLGLSIGMVLGYYISQFFTMILAMHYFSQITKQYGFTALDAWRHDFDWKIIKECLWYGIGISWAPLIGVGLGLIQLEWSLSIVPGYSTWVVLAGLGAGIGSSINMGSIDISSPFAESINNGKKELSNFYISQAFKYWGFILFAMMGVIIVLLPIINKVIYIVPAVAQQYEPALIFVVPGMIAILLDVPINQFTTILAQTGKVWTKSNVELCANIINMVLWYLCLYVWKIWSLGTFGIITLFVLIQIPAKIFRFLIYVFYIQKKIIRMRISWWQTFGASALTFLVVLGVGYAFVQLMFIPLLYGLQDVFGAVTGTIITAVIGVLVIIIGFMLVVFPLTYAIMGGWDDFGLEVLRKSYLLSGPSKMFIYLIYRLSVYGSKISPLYNKFPIRFEHAASEAKELLEVKHADQRRLDEDLKRNGGL